jgi:putative acetyltransferase
MTELVRADMKIRAELPDDATEIHNLVASAFPTEAEAFLVDELRRTGAIRVSLVAVDDDTDHRIVGYVAFSPVLAADGREGIGLAPVAVAATHRRRGIAAQLIERGLESCREQGFAYAVVLGAPAYYSRFGFEPAPSRGLADEYEGGNSFQVLELVPGGVPNGAGLVRYSPAFAAFA